MEISVSDAKIFLLNYNEYGGVHGYIHDHSANKIQYCLKSENRLIYPLHFEQVIMQCYLSLNESHRCLHFQTVGGPKSDCVLCFLV